MRVLTGSSDLVDIKEACGQACESFLHLKPELILFFADSERLELFSRTLATMFPHSTIVGSSVYATFTPQANSARGIKIAAFIDGIKVKSGVIHDIERYPSLHADVIKEATDFIAPTEPGQRRVGCIMFAPAGLAAEEMVLDAFNEVLEPLHIPLFGGSSSAQQDVRGKVALNGKAYEKSAVFFIFELEDTIFYRYQENIFQPSGKRFLVTKADVETRTLYELDGHPAHEVLCRALDVTREELPRALESHPFGRTYGSKLFATVVESIDEDGTITTLSRLYNQTEIELLGLVDMDKEKRKTFEDLHKLLKRMDFSLVLTSDKRVVMLEKAGIFRENKEFLDAGLGSYIGATSHGQYLDDYFINMSLIILAIGEKNEDK